MLILEMVLDGHKYTVHGDSIAFSTETGDDTVQIENPQIFVDGTEKTDFGENFVGHHFNCEEAASSLIRGCINQQADIELIKTHMILHDKIEEFRKMDGFNVTYNKDDHVRGMRRIPKKYLAEYKTLNLELIDGIGRAFYTDGDTFIMLYPDGNICTDIDAFYCGAFNDAIEKGGNIFVIDLPNYNCV